MAPDKIKIPFSQISTTPQRYCLDSLGIETEKESFGLQGTVSLSCSLKKKSATRILLQATMRATLLLSCDRCLQVYPNKVDSNFRLICEVNISEHWKLKDIDLSACDLDIVQLVEPVVDLEEIVRQQLYLSLPQRQLCNENCKGICPECGVDMNIDPCHCRGDRQTSPFAVLGVLQKK